VWLNTALSSQQCPAHLSFERAAQKVSLSSWEDGEFGWHGTKSVAAVQGICWEGWDTTKRSGQACGPGEYFSRGTPIGLEYSLTYAGGDAGHMLVVAWIVSSRLGAAPSSPKIHGACENSGASCHIVCNNPVGPERGSTGEMYCIPLAVVAFGNADKKLSFREG